MEKDITVYMTLEGRNITLILKRAETVLEAISLALSRLRMPFKPVNFACYTSGGLHLKQLDLNKTLDQIAHEEATGIQLYVIFKERSYEGDGSINPYGSRFFNYH
jgi:hypothetical protein